MTTPDWGVASAHYDEAATAMGLDSPPPIVERIPPGSRVLDLGCSVGQLARHLVERDCVVVGLELDPEAAERARRWCAEVHTGDLDLVHLPAIVGDDRFDVIVAADVLEHLRDPGRLLREARALLRPGGTVVTTVPNVAHGSVRLALLTGRFDYADLGIMDRTHLRFFTRATLEELFEVSGYGITSIEPLELPVEMGVPYDAKALPRGIEKAVKKMAEAEAYSYLLVASPQPG